MKRSPPPPQRRAARRRIAGRAQQDHILDPYQRQRKLHDGTRCPQCGALYQDGRWQWTAMPQAVQEELCPACRRINDRFPAGIVNLRGAFARAHREELIRVARHQEEAEKAEHPLNRIMSIEEEPDGTVVNTTDIHLPRRIGEALERAFSGALDFRYEEDGYFVRVTWRRET
jgi:NMD protein affecting ribosome stability and mRNA decay